MSHLENDAIPLIFPKNLSIKYFCVILKSYNKTRKIYTIKKLKELFSQQISLKLALDILNKLPIVFDNFLTEKEAINLKNKIEQECEIEVDVIEQFVPGT